MKVLLDTHVLLWWLEAGDRLSAAQRKAIEDARESPPLLLSDISLWEIATLHMLGTIRLGLPLREWLERASAPPLVERCGITPAVAAEVTSLPPTFHRDPADRIIVATARVHGAAVLTADRRILDAGIVRAVP